MSKLHTHFAALGNELNPFGRAEAEGAAPPADGVSRRVTNGTAEVSIMFVVPVTSAVLGASWSSKTVMSFAPGLRK